MSEALCIRPVVGLSVRVKKAEEMGICDIRLDYIYQGVSRFGESKPEIRDFLEKKVNSAIGSAASRQARLADGRLSEQEYSIAAEAAIKALNTRIYFDRFGYSAIQQAREFFAPTVMEGISDEGAA